MENVISKCNICNQNFTARRYKLRGPGVLFLFFKEVVLVFDPFLMSMVEVYDFDPIHFEFVIQLL